MQFETRLHNHDCSSARVPEVPVECHAAETKFAFAYREDDRHSGRTWWRARWVEEEEQQTYTDSL